MSRVGKFEARLVLLEQGSTVDGMALSFGQTQNDEEVMPVVTVPTVDVPDSVIDQLNNEKSISNENRWPELYTKLNPNEYDIPYLHII
ncbi:hypothetical protein GLOIN_2v1671980 [Rhizophagus irregularis DAOM 181602=DAOM 197198]|nr:hypothetical protein GLOIN_2v1671980 [Rhizophagus irregularis DAOM 181602=DAOM 197198]